MASQPEAKRRTETTTGFTNVAFDLIAILENKLKGIAAFEAYKLDCDEAGDVEARRIIEEMEARDAEIVHRLKGLLKARL